MNELQKKLLDMLSFFHNFCEENDLIYYAAGGTALGAIRHKGFIPWDDDVDIIMPRKDYERLKQLSKNRFDATKKYVIEFPLENLDFIYSYAKIYDTTTTLIESNRYKTKRGVFIDVFPLDGVGESEEAAIEQFKKAEKKINLLSTITCGIRKGRKLYKNVAVVVGRCIPKFIISPQKAIKKINEMGQAVDYDQSKFVANLAGIWHEKEIVEKSWLGEPKLEDFEDIKIYCPQQSDLYLSKIYGNYMELPPIEKRKSHHDFLLIDLNKSYLN